jgi:MFS family permease
VLFRSQGAIYAAYFLGAFATTLPGGILSDRYGRVPVIRAGLLLTLASGLLLTVTVSPVPVIILRCIEGLGAGLFVASAMSYVNSLPDHARMSGYFMAMLNLGLVLGLLLSGWLAAHLDLPVSGILLFTGITGIVAAVSLVLNEPARPEPGSSRAVIGPLIAKYRWMWVSSVVLVGITGVVVSLYPKFSGQAPDIVSIWIAGMSVATIIAVMIASRIPLPPVATIRWSAVLMVPGVLLSFVTPLGFIVIGALAGIVMIAQMAFLSDVRDHQGVAMGLFSTTSYLGMALLPFLAGVVADTAGFFTAFCVTALCAVLVALTIGRCTCRMNTTG